MSKNLVITGVSGFIGRYVAEEALRRRYDVTGVDREQSHTQGIEFIRADIRDRKAMIRLMAGKDHVIHLAGVTSNVEFLRNPVECYAINANGFLSIIDAAAQSGCTRLVYASSSAVYVDAFSEEAVIDFRRQSSHYAKTKIMNEMMAKSYEEIYGIKTIGLRYFNVYGEGENVKGDYASIITLFQEAKKKGECLLVYGDGTQARDLINVKDVARITLNLLEKGSYPVYNVGTGVATTYMAVARAIDEHSIRHVPNPLTSYQYYTKAETARLKGALGDYEFVELGQGMREMKGYEASNY